MLNKTKCSVKMCLTQYFWWLEVIAPFRWSYVAKVIKLSILSNRRREIHYTSSRRQSANRLKTNARRATLRTQTPARHPRVLVYHINALRFK